MIHRLANCFIGIFVLAISCYLFLSFHKHGEITATMQPGSIEITGRGTEEINITGVTELAGTTEVTDAAEITGATDAVEITGTTDVAEITGAIDAAEITSATDMTDISNVDEGSELPEQDSYHYVGYVDIFLQMDNDSVSKGIKLYVAYDKCYFFLPTCASSCQFTLQYNEADYEISIDGEKIAGGQPISYAELSKEHVMSITKCDMGDMDSLEGETLAEAEYILEFMHSENLPAIFVDTANDTMEYLHQSKNNKEAGEMICILPDGRVDSMGALYMHARGSSSFEIARKKSYKIIMDVPTDILSMGKANKWVLQANALDSTKARNGVAYELIRNLRLGYAIESTYVDVYFNGEYGGNYLLCEPVEVGSNRIAIDAEDSYLLVIDRVTEEDSFFLDQYGTTFLIRYPEENTDEDIERLRGYINAIENRIRNCDTWEKYQKLREYIDIESFVIMYLVNMITNETDANAASTFFYFDGRSGKLFAGPAWDYDRAWGNAKGRGSYRFNAYWDGIPEKLSLIPYFQQEVQEIIRDNQDMLARLKENVDVVADKIRMSVCMEEIIYGETDSGFVEIGDYDTEIAFLKHYIEHRVDWACDIILHPEDYHRVLIHSDTAEMTYWVRDGDTIPAADLAYIYEVHACDSLCFENGTIFWDGCPVLSDIVLYEYMKEEATDAGTALVTEEDAALGSLATEGETDKENWGMGLLAFIIILAPGFIVMLISMGSHEENGLDTLPVKAIKLSKLAIQYFCYDFLILLFVYGSIYLVKGSITLSLSGVAGHDFDYTLYHVNVVFLIMLLELVGACALGGGIRAYRKMKGKMDKSGFENE